MKLLIVEDEKPLLESISNYLGEEGYLCEHATSYFEAEDKVISYAYDIVLLDITLPGGSGLDLIDLIKETHPTSGILIISAKDSLDDKLIGLDLGADDYITKPFHLAEVKSRVNAIIRRNSFEGNSNVNFHEISIDTEAKHATVNDRPLTLTRKEYDLLLYFITNKNRVITKEALAEHMWGDHMDMANNFDFVYTHVKNLRKKIVQAGGNDYIKTVYGMGYKFSEQ